MDFYAKPCEHAFVYLCTTRRQRGKFKVVALAGAVSPHFYLLSDHQTRCDKAADLFLFFTRHANVEGCMLSSQQRPQRRLK
jgi:predicted metal-binding protein